MSIESYIVDNYFNKDNFNKLIDSFDKESFIPFVGAGTSRVLGEPDWDKLLSDVSKGFKLNIRRLKLDGKTDYPSTFSNLYKKLTPDGKKQFYKKLFDIIEPTQTDLTGFHLKLVDLFNVFITTNYDSPIEKAFYNQHKDRKIKKHFFSCYEMDKLNDCIVYLHGHKDINFCIIKKEDYEYFYPTVSKKNGIPILEDFLSEIFSNKRIIFLGFSFNDQYIASFIAHLNSTKSFKGCHYWILSEDNETYREIKHRADEYKRIGLNDKADNEIANFFNGKMNIKPVVYRQNYNIFLEKLFHKLKESLPIEITLGTEGGTPVR